MSPKVNLRGYVERLLVNETRPLWRDIYCVGNPAAPGASGTKTGRAPQAPTPGHR